MALTFDDLVEDTVAVPIAGVPLAGVDGSGFRAKFALLQLAVSVRLAFVQESNVHVLIRKPGGR